MAKGCSLPDKKQSLKEELLGLAPSNSDFNIDKEGNIIINYSKDSSYKSPLQAKLAFDNYKNRVLKHINSQYGEKFKQLNDENVWFSNTGKTDSKGLPIMKLNFEPKPWVEIAQLQLKSEMLESIELEHKYSTNGEIRVPLEEDYEAIGLKDHYLEQETDNVYFALSANALNQMGNSLGQINNVIAYKESIIHKLKHRLTKVRNDKRTYKNDANIYKALVKEEQYLVQVLEGDPTKGVTGLIGELENYKNMPSMELFFIQADEDMNLLDELMAKGDPEDIETIRAIISFYKSATSLDKNIQNVFFEENDLYDDKGNIILPLGVRDELEIYAKKILAYENMMAAKDMDAILGTANELKQVKNRGGITADELNENQQKGMADIHWVDKYMMSTSNAIIREDSIMTQVMQIVLRDAINEGTAKSQKFNQKLDELSPKVKGKLPVIKGLPFKGYDYNIFRAKNSKGQYRDGIVQRYTYELYSLLSKSRRDFEAKMQGAYKIKDLATRNQLISQAVGDRDKQLRENTIAIDIRKIKSFGLSPQFTIDDGGKHEAELRALLGDKGFAKEIAKQEELLKEYDVKLETYIDNLITREGVPDQNSLSDASKLLIEEFEKRYNPMYAAEHLNDFQTIKSSAGAVIYQNTQFVNLVPRKHPAKMVFDNALQDFKMVEDTSKNTGFYDEDFKAIEADDDLEQFHKLLEEFSTEIIGSLPPHIKANFNLNSLPQMRKSLAEVLVDKNLNVLQKLTTAIRHLYDTVRQNFGENVGNPFSQAPINPVTGRPEYEINSDNLSGAKGLINERYQQEKLFLMNMMGISLSKPPKQLLVNLNSAPPAVRDYIRLQVGEKLYNNLLSSGQVDLFKELKDAVTHQVVSEQSFDLPKIIKFFSATAMNYQARNKVLPILNIMKNYYDNIKDVELDSLGRNIVNSATNNNRPTGESRANANARMNSWFNRAVLGNYTLNYTLGDTTVKEDTFGKINASMNNKSYLKIHSKEEKAEKEKINLIIAQLNDQLASTTDKKEKSAINKKISQLELRRDNIGKVLTGKKAIDSLFGWIRFIGLGYNLSSQVTNFLEGQSANMISAASGRFFTPENIYEANNIIIGSTIKNFTKGLITTDGAAKARALMDRYDILQDASNELQKASEKSAFGSMNALRPYYFMSRTEYLNQAPLMIAVLMDEKITSSTGEVSSVWDAMDRNGRLKPGFDTPENVANWENNSGADYNAFSSKINKCIVDTHGDYDELRGNMASESIVLKAAFMFKRWMARQWFNRYGVEQEDLESGQKVFRGRYRDHTKASGMLQGALVGLAGVGLLGLGPIGVAIGAGAGFSIAATMGNKGQIQHQLGFIAELGFILRETMLNLVRMPVNGLAGKPIIKSADMSNFSAVDKIALQNLQANIMEFSMMIGQFALVMMAKSLLWDDEDDEEDEERRLHNYIVNTLMSMSESLGMYTNPVQTLEVVWNQMAVKNFWTNFGKTIKGLNDLLIEGDDTIPTGPNAGKSQTWNYGKKIAVPSVLRMDETFGFGAKTKRQIKPHPLDNLFYGEEKLSKKQISRIKSRHKEKIKNLGLDEEEEKKLLKALDKQTRKKKGKSYSEMYEHVEDLDEKGDLEGIYK